MDEKLRPLQLMQLEILKMVDSICRENNINYSLYAGTLLGAVRHQGFIPWDDDLDICMERDEYDKFIRVWEELRPRGYILQNKENTPAFPQSFTKIRKDHTTFLQNDYERGEYHTGVFIDIFPIDRMPSNKVKQYIFKLQCMFYQLFTREFVPPKSSGIVKKVSAFLLWCIPKKNRRKTRSKLLKRITQYNNRNDFNIATIETVETMQIKYPVDMLNSYTSLKFEDSEFMCFSKWDEYLKGTYGDYMKLPPESDRAWKHHPIILDFEKNYEELDCS